MRTIGAYTNGVDAKRIFFETLFEKICRFYVEGDIVKLSENIDKVAYLPHSPILFMKIGALIIAIYWTKGFALNE